MVATRCRIVPNMVVRLAKAVGRLQAGDHVIVEKVKGNRIEITIPEYEGIGFWRCSRDDLQA